MNHAMIRSMKPITILIALLAVAACTDLSGRGPADPAAYRHPRHRHAPPADPDAPPRLTIGIEVVEDLGITRVLQQVDDETIKDRGAGLTGVLRVTLTNTGAHELVLEDLGVHNLVFERVGTREEYAIVHEGICSRLCTGDPNVVRHLDLDPGESRVLRFADWGHSDAWEMHPPSGRYELGYRIREMDPGRRLMPGCSSPSMAVAERVAVCKRNLQDAGYWHGAFQAPRTKVRLAPTEPRWVR
jgi:hypothetical protein